MAHIEISHNDNTTSDREDAILPTIPSGAQTPASIISGFQTPLPTDSIHSTDDLLLLGNARDFHISARLHEPSAGLSQHVSSAIDDSLGQELHRQLSKQTNPDEDGTAGFGHDLERRVTRRRTSALPPQIIELEDRSRPSGVPQAAEHASPVKLSQGKPQELPNLLAEIVFIMVCSMGQLLFALLLGNITVNQVTLIDALGIQTSQTPWIVGAFLLANGLSVVIAGSLADLAGPKSMMVGAFAWLTVWNTVGVFSINHGRSVLFFVVRAMQGLAVGVLVSASMSALGRIYQPGMRKTRVFSSMAAMAPFGFWIGALQGGALSSHLNWIFGSSAIVCGICGVAGYLTIPDLTPARDNPESEQLSLKHFDYLGATCAVLGCGCLIFGLTQGAPSHWSPYSYTLILVGVVSFIAFYFAERRAARPLIDNRLWLTPSFAPLIAAYFLGFGSYVGTWQFYAVRFWLTIQNKSPLTVALYLTPNAIVGVLATWIVSKTLHVLPGHWIFTASMVAFAMGPVFFLPQTMGTSYWALSMPGIALVTFGPDLSFAAASIFITSSVAKSYQGSAGSLLVTVQNLSAAVMTAIGDSIGAKVSGTSNGSLTLPALRAIWWFSFGISIFAAALCAATVRIPKSEEKEHIS